MRATSSTLCSVLVSALTELIPSTWWPRRNNDSAGHCDYFSGKYGWRVGVGEALKHLTLMFLAVLWHAPTWVESCDTCTVRTIQFMPLPRDWASTEDYIFVSMQCRAVDQQRTAGYRLFYNCHDRRASWRFVLRASTTVVELYQKRQQKRWDNSQQHLPDFP